MTVSIFFQPFKALHDFHTSQMPINKGFQYFTVDGKVEQKVTKATRNKKYCHS